MKNTKTPKTKFYTNRIAFIRAVNKYSMEDFAKEIGITKQSISRFEADKTMPSLTTVLCICDKFKIPIDFFTKETINVEIKGNEITYKL